MSKIKKEKYIMNLLNNKTIHDTIGIDLESSEPVDNLQVNHKYDKLVKQSQQLEKVYKFHSSIIQNLSSGLIIIDMSGLISFTNKASREMLGYENEELLDKSFDRLFTNVEEGKTFVKFVTEFKKKYRNKEYNFKTRDGNDIPVGLTTTPLADEYNQYEGIIIIFKDLTEVLRLKKQIERMDRLALLGELSAGIAHEIRNPLAGIKAAAQLLEETMEQEDDRVRLLERIIKEIDKSNRLLKEFFKFAKPSKPKLTFNDFETLIDGLFLLIGARLRKQNIKYDLQFEINAPQVFVDETQIEQVLLNILLNSMDAMPEGGELRIKTSVRDLTSFERDNINRIISENREIKYLVVEISDSGKGIPEENIDKIFDPFFTTKADGLGLGLSISSRLLEENLGKIDVLSSTDKGTTFSLLLPCFHHS